MRRRGGLPERRVERVVIDGLSPDAPELELSRLLDECRTAREERHAHTSNKAQAAAGLLVVGFQQRLLSSVEAFARSLAVHRRTVERHCEQGQADNAAGKEPDPPAGTGQASEHESPAPANDETHDLFLTPPAADDERGEQEADLIEAEEEVQIEAITVAAESSSTSDHGKEHAELWRQEQQLLDRMQAIAERARHQPDSKTRRLIDWIREHMCPTLPPFGSQPAGLPTRWNDRRVLIFTEDREGTKRYLKPPANRSGPDLGGDPGHAPAAAQERPEAGRLAPVGRLCLYGRRAERLHEEIVPLAARWIEPARRSGPLKAYAREAETRTLDLLEQSLTGRLDWAPHDVIRGRLLAAAPPDVEASSTATWSRSRGGSGRGAALLRRRSREVQEKLRAAWRELLDPAKAG